MSLLYSEIMEQHDALMRTAKYIEAETERLPVLFSRRIVILGCGLGYSLAKSMAAMTGMRAGLQATALSAGDVLLNAERYGSIIEDSVIIALSHSGSDSEILLALDRLRALDVRFTLTSFTCARNSRLAGMSSFSLELYWAYDSSYSKTRASSCLYFAYAYCLALSVCDKPLLEDLRTVSGASLEFMQQVESQAANIASIPWTNSIVLGDAELCGICEESALLFNEICQLPSSYHHLLDCRYGPFVLFDEDTLVLAVLGEGCKYEYDLLREITWKGAPVVVFAGDKPVRLDGVKSITFPHPVSHIAKGLPFIQLCQLIAYFKSFHSGSNPDTVGWDLMGAGMSTKDPALKLR